VELLLGINQFAYRRIEQKTATGIFLPSSATSSPLPEATVIAVGPGAPNRQGNVVPVSVKPGDRVLLPGWGGNSIKVGEHVSYLSTILRPWLMLDSVQEYHLFKDSEILAKVVE
jgi:chaperonin GroES